MTTTRDIIDSVITSNGIGGITGSSLRGLLDSLITFESLAAVGTSTIRSDVHQILTLGFAYPTDGGGAVYTRSTSAPSHNLYTRSVDGAYWVYPPSVPINFAACGAVGDAVIGNYSVGTDCTRAMNLAGSYAKAESNAGRGVLWNISPGVYNFNATGGDGGGCYQCLANISKLHMIGYGATFQPTSTAASVFSWPPAYQANPGVFQIGQTFSYLISTTAVGNNVVNTINHSDAGNITPGEMIVITSIYGFIGYSPFQFEYARVTGVDAFTGAVTLDRNVKWVHRSDFPDYDGVFDLGQPYGNCYFGKARIWRLTQQGYSFDLDHIYEGFSVLPTINNSPNYQVSTGRKITWLNNPTIVGASPSWAEEVTYKHCGFVSGEEPDKMVDRIVFEDCVVPYIDFQSPVNRVEFRNCQCGNLNTGAAKILTVDGCDVGQLSSAILFATSSAVTVKNSFVRSYYGGPRSSNAVTIDGVNVWFGVNGVGIITVVKQWIPSDQAYLLVNLNTIPGMWVSLGGYPECNLGTGIIQYVTEDSTKFYIHTTLPYSTIPSWGNNTITFGRTGAQRYYNITGCDAARTLHLATELGCEPWEVTYQNMAGNPSFDLHPPGGVIQKIEINVMVASTSASTMLIYVYFWSYANPGGAQIHSTLTINTGIAGRRTLTQGITSPGITGFKSGDSWIYDGGAAITAIPGDICFSMSGGFTPGNSLVGALVVVDCGLFAKPFTGTQLGIVTGEAR